MVVLSLTLNILDLGRCKTKQQLLQYFSFFSSQMFQNLLGLTAMMFQLNWMSSLSIVNWPPSKCHMTVSTTRDITGITLSTWELL